MNRIQNKVFEKYVDDIVSRLSRFTLLIAIGEFCLMLLDFQCGFFAENPINYINLVAELIIITVSLLTFLECKKYPGHPEIKINRKLFIIGVFRISIILPTLMFIFTDIYVRHKELGAYMVFLFVLQCIPDYNAVVNITQFALIGIVTVVEYLLFVDSGFNILFATLVIFICFAITTEFLRKFFISQLENYFLAEENSVRYQRLSRQTVKALSEAVEAKDSYTRGHSQRVAEYSAAIAEKLGYSEERIQEVSIIALMHDIGKIGVPDYVITKNDRLTDEEFAQIKKHPLKGYEILKDISELPGIGEGARWHHERFDGKGYPDGLKGMEIPEIARIIAVADAYDAMTSNRSYRKAMTQEEVRKQIERNSGTQFDPVMATIMLELIDADKDYVMHE